MDYIKYFEVLEERFQKYFDIERNIHILDMDIDMFAKYSSLNVKTFLTKNDVIDSYSENEYCFAKKYENLSLEEVNRFIGFLKNSEAEYVKPGRNHMSTKITGILVCNGEIPRDAKALIKKFKYGRAYKLFLHGWCDVRLVLVDLNKEDITVSRAASNVKKVYSLTPLNKK